MSRKILPLILLLTVITYSLYCQNINGLVLDNEMESPLPGATVILLLADDYIGTITDGEGRFIINNVESGRYAIQVSFLGFESQVIPNILTKPGKDAQIVVRLKPQITQVKEVTISASNRQDSPVNQMAAVSVRSFSVEQTEKYAGSLGDPARMAQNFAGVVLAGDQRNDIVIRGNAPSGLLWRIDGLPVPNPNHFGAAGSTGGPVGMLNNNLLTRSDFYTGAFPAEFGNAISGVFDIKMRSGNKNHRQHVLQTGFNGFDLGSEGPFVKGGQGSYLISYRYSMLDLFSKIGLDLASGAVPEYQDLSFKFDLPTRNAGRFQLFGLGGVSNILFEQKNDNDQSFNNISGFNTSNGSNMGVLGLSHVYYFNQDTRIKSQIGLSGHQVHTQVDSVNFITDEQTVFYGENTGEEHVQFKTTLKHRFNQKNYFEAGARILRMRANYLDSTRIDDGKYMFLTDSDSDLIYLTEGFTQINHFLSDNFSVSGGLHYQYFDLNNSHSLEPRINFLWKINPLHSIGGGYGLHSQTQPLLVYFMQSYLSDDSRVTTNTNLGMTKSHQLAINHNWMLSENFMYKLEAYYQYLKDVPVEQHQSTYSMLNYGASFHQERVDSLVNGGYGQNYGVEMTLEKYLSHGFYFLFTGTLYESKYKTLDNVWRNTQFNGNFIANLLSGYEFKLGKNLLGFDIRTVYAGGKRFPSIDLEASRASGYPIYDPIKAFDKKADPYFRTDLRISFKKPGKRSSQEWAIDFQNLTNHKNVFSQYFDPETGDIKFNYQSSFTPMVLYRLNF